MKLGINRIVEQTKNEGFGNRYCIWVQGCSIRCPGCRNSHMWSFDKGKKLSVEKIIVDVKSQNNIEGITLLGGEPLDQKVAVAELLERIKKSGYSVILFTGYRYDLLKYSTDFYIKKILENTDLLIDGPFLQKELDYSRPWIGSKNQNYIFLSNVYSDNDLKELINKSKYEVRIYSDGSIGINGIGKLDKFQKILDFNAKE